MKYKIILLSIFLFVLIYFTTNQARSQWAEASLNRSSTILSVSVIDANTFWVCGDTLIARTTNGGVNWIYGYTNSVTYYNIYAIDANNALYTQLNSTGTSVYKTTNGGLSDSPVFIQSDGFINSIWMTTSTNGFIMGDPVGGRWSLWKTTNGGLNWDSTGMYLPQYETEAGYFNCMMVINNNIWFTAHPGNRVYHSSNGGLNWNIQTINGVFSYPTDIWFNTLQNGMVGDNLSGEMTINGGTTWSQVSRELTETIGLTGMGIQWFSIGQEQSPPYSMHIFYSSNNGSNWSDEYTTPIFCNHMSISRYTSGSCRVVAVGYEGRVYISDRPIIGINKISSDVPEKFILQQNYPNPFNPVTKIKFALPKGSFAKLVVYDALGRELETLVNGQLGSGTYEASWQADKYSTGVYFYRLTTGDYTEIKKMVLVK